MDCWTPKGEFWKVLIYPKVDENVSSSAGICKMGSPSNRNVLVAGNACVVDDHERLSPCSVQLELADLPFHAKNIPSGMSSASKT